MGEEDIRSSPGLNMDHEYLRKIEYNQHTRQQQHKEDASRRHETAKLARRVGFPAKSSKPTMEIYRPPGVRLSGDISTFMKQFSAPGTNGHTVASDLRFTPSPEPAHHKNKVQFHGSQSKSSEKKSALKRSKSFTGREDMTTGSTHTDGFPAEYQDLIKRALHDPNSLTSLQLMEIVRVMCSKAVESIHHAEPAAQMCFAIIEREKGETFLESLLNSCREWFSERDKLLRSVTGAGSRRWIAYITFLAWLYLWLKSRHRQILVANGPSGTPAAADRSLSLVMLLYECCKLILQPPSVTCLAEIECLRFVLTSIGQQLEQDSPQRMQHLVAHMRDAFINPSISAQIRKALLELVELHASKWQLDLPQSMYYFPYTSVDRK
ncbi:MIF4G domain-containing protein-like isoform X1 [Tachypleus tridentatus]|uniref:MIF4G domain-containing protein-like isoform X1 n=2 Tax=Tachypleus tridentatus TaxID=6853 RepID=UPI003FD48BE1